MTQRPLTGRRVQIALALLLLVGGVPLADSLLAASMLGDPVLGGRLVGSGVSTLTLVVAGYLAGAWLRPVLAAGGCLLTAGMLTVANQVAYPGRYSAPNDLFFFTVLVGGTALAGALVTARRRQARDLARLSSLREEQRVDELRVARLEERNRVDAGVTRALVQRLGAIVVQASGAGQSPRSTPEALPRIEHAGRAVLDDLRETLGSLRAPQADGTEPVASETTAAPVGWVDVMVGLCGVPLVFETTTGGGSRGPVWANVLMAVLLGLPLVVRRQHPLLAVGSSYVLAALTSLWLTPLRGTVTSLLPLSVTAFALGAHTRGRSRPVSLLVLVVGTYAIGLAGPASTLSGDGVVPTAVWAALSWLAGMVTAQHERRATRLRELIARVEAGHGLELRLAVAEQRQAVARELHDTVAHAMTVVCLHAEAAQRRDVEETVRASLDTIERAARDAMARLRVGLESLETEPEDGPGDGTEDGDLATEVRAFATTLGLTPSLVIQSEPASNQVTDVRRVLREALVNVSRHAPGSAVTVRLTRAEDQLVVEVVNGSTDAPPYDHGSGTGLLGLGEQVRDRGGRLEHRRTPDGGFRVAAYLPDAVSVPS